MNIDQFRNAIFAGKVDENYIQNLSIEDFLAALDHFRIITYKHFTKFTSKINYNTYPHGRGSPKAFIDLGKEIEQAVNDKVIDPDERVLMNGDGFWCTTPQQVFLPREELEKTLLFKVRESYGKHKTKLHNKAVKKLVKEESKDIFTEINGKKYKLVEMVE